MVESFVFVIMFWLCVGVAYISYNMGRERGRIEAVQMIGEKQ